MAHRTITTEMKFVGVDEYVEGISRITDALNKMTEALKQTADAKKEFDALLEKAPNQEKEDYVSIQFR